MVVGVSSPRSTSDSAMSAGQSVISCRDSHTSTGVPVLPVLRVDR